jgi:hypothetical protein
MGAQKRAVVVFVAGAQEFRFEINQKQGEAQGSIAEKCNGK